MGDERFIPLQELSYFQQTIDFPIILEKAKLYRDQLSFKSVLQCKLTVVRSVPLPIKTVMIEVSGAGKQGKTFGPIPFTYDDLNINGGKTFGSRTPILLDPLVVEASITFVEVTLTDGTILRPSPEPLPVLPRIRIQLLNFEELEYVKNKVQQLPIPLAQQRVPSVFLPAATEEVWLCACGHISDFEREACPRCGRAQDWQLNFLTHAKIRSALEELKKERLQKEQELRQKRALVFKKIKWVMLRIVLPILLAIALVVGAFFGAFYYADQQVAKGEYDSAIAIFEKFGDMNYAPQRIANATYGKGVQYLDAQDYDNAKAVFQKIPSFSNASILVLDADYRKANSLRTDGKLEEARAIYTSISDYADSYSQIKDIDYDLATRKYEAGDFLLAEAAFKELGNYKDAETMVRESKYQYGVELLRSGELEACKEIFEEVGNYKESANLTVKADYGIAVRLLEDGKAAEALAIFNTIKTYEDVPAQIRAINYKFAKEKLDEGDLQAAFELLVPLKGYLDVNEIIAEYAYPTAIEHYNKAEWTEAIYFLRLVDIEAHPDATNKLTAAKANEEQAIKKAKYDEAMEMIQAKNYKGAYNVLVDLKYSNSDSLASYYALIAYPWKVTITPTKSTFSRSDHFTANFSVTGGPPGAKFNLTMSCTLPNGGKVYDVGWDARNGSSWSYSCYYSNWVYGSTGQGKFVAKNYATGEKLEEVFFRVGY